MPGTKTATSGIGTNAAGGIGYAGCPPPVGGSTGGVVPTGGNVLSGCGCQPPAHGGSWIGFVGNAGSHGRGGCVGGRTPPLPHPGIPGSMIGCDGCGRGQMTGGKPPPPGTCAHGGL